MYNKILTVIAIAIGAIGTVKAVLSVIKMRLKDIILSRSTLQQDIAEISVLHQVYDARVGTALVIFSAIIQASLEFIDITSFTIFVSIAVMILVVTISWWIIMYILYRIGKKRIEDKMEPGVKAIYEERHE